MEDKGVYKIRVLPLFLLIFVILLILVIIVMGILMYQQQQKINDMEANQNIAPQEEVVIPEVQVPEEPAKTVPSNKVENAINRNPATNATTETPETEFTRKIVENRSYIYDAQYSPTGIRTSSYTSSDGKTYSVSDIVVPYINMVSSDASSMNEEIEALYNQCISEFTVCSQNKNSYIKVSYISYVTSNIYSIVITIQRGQASTETTDYMVYNFDNMSGSKLDYNQVCYIAGVNNAAESVRETIDELEDYSKFYITDPRAAQDVVQENKAEIQGYKNQVYTNYQEDLLNGRLIYFLDNNLKLNIIVKVTLPNDEGSYLKIMIVEA